MSDYTDAQIQDMRDQVLSAALALGLRAADAADATDGAVAIRLDDEVELAGVTWRLFAQWDRGDASVVLRGNAQFDAQVAAQGPEAVQVGPIVLLFGEGEDRRAQFSYDVPVPWLRAVAAAHDPRAV